MTYDDFKKLWAEACEKAAADDPDNPQRALFHHLLTNFDKTFEPSGESGAQ